MTQGKHRYRVTVYYREPQYAQSRGIPIAEYQGTFTVTAQDADDAKRLAMIAFQEAAQRASTSWPREVTRVVVAQA